MLMCRVLRSQISGLQLTDPSRMPSALGVVLLRCGCNGLPAWQATKVEPMEALRDE